MFASLGVCVVCVCVLRASTIHACASMGYGVNVCMCMNGATVHSVCPSD